jgi:putative hydrolases of HD superfamily
VNSIKISPQELIKLALEINVLKRVIRTGWKRKGIINPESVADHSWMVTMLVYILAPHFNIDREKAIKIALIHDLGEISASDIVWEQGKQIIGSQEEKHSKERASIKKNFSSYPDYINLWEEYISQQSEEAKFVKHLDKLEMLIQAYEYEKNRENQESLQEFWENVEKYLKDTEFEPYLNELKLLRIK